ncbi:hypothetical protein [Pseudorhodobacter aquimaris]|uniref:hypothetical protein n=1 Tax=Pseudorhodobacter aquimaris TaxID=687412 RepID=UPI00067D05C1|nr:hypothetical protein [Pseudorhodobacter aquimaris]
MEVLVWIGALVSLVGVAGLGWCVVLALRARNSDEPEDVVRKSLQKVVIYNMVALGISALGLMLVVMGIFLG